MSTKVTSYEQALAFNNARIFGALAKHGVATVKVSYDGSGDSGQLNHPTFHNKDDEEIHPDLGDATYYRRLPGRYDLKANRLLADTFEKVPRATLESVIENVCWDLLQKEHGGWEINEGGQGEFTFDVEERTLSLHHEDNIVEVQVSEHTF